jgi:hypothetical protein
MNASTINGEAAYRLSQAFSRRKVVCACVTLENGTPPENAKPSAKAAASLNFMEFLPFIASHGCAEFV